MSKKATRIFQEQAYIEKTMLKNISEYRPTGDEVVRHGDPRLRRRE